MKNFFRKLALFFKKKWVWTLCIAIVIVLLIWFVGPLLAFNEYKPWETQTARLVTICAVFLLWGLSIVFSNWRAAVRHKKAMSSEQLQEKLILEEKVQEERQAVTTIYKKAIQTLKRSSIYKGRSNQWKYDLPLYLLIGPEGSGKTSLLDFSGLDFPLNSIEQNLTKNIEGTRYCEWYFGENGIIIDTAGRYFTQETPDIDATGWSTLLSLLRRHKRNRPLNGVLVNIPVDELLSGDEVGLERLARQTRARLYDIHQKLGTQCPVYILFSKADQIVGFEEFFDNLSQEESGQVLGVTFTKDQKQVTAVSVRDEFERLLERLNKQIIFNMHQERDIQRRGKILDFPYQFNQIIEQLCLFVELAISGNRYQAESHLRGFYFMSAPHLMEHMNESTINIGRNLGLSSRALPVYRQGRPRFIHQLFSMVIFPESELATLDDAEKNRINWRQRSVYIGSAATLAGICCLWSYSFHANDSYLENVEILGTQLTNEQKELVSNHDLSQLQPVLNTGYKAVNVFPADDQLSMLYQLGLYQGHKTTPTLQKTYNDQLLQQMLPSVAKQLEAQIRNNLGNREKLLTYLRAYLMLNYTQYRNNSYIANTMQDHWGNLYSGNMGLQQDLTGHLDRLLALPFVYPIDDELVARARQILRNEPIANLVYNAMKEQASVLGFYRLSDHLGSYGHMITGADRKIPKFFTKQGYQEYFLINGSKFITSILKDNWVLGDVTTLSPIELKKLVAQVEQLYFLDYTDQWSSTINNLNIKSVNSFSESSTQLTGFVSPNSPFALLLIQIKEHTKLPGIMPEADETQATTNQPSNTEKALSGSGKTSVKRVAKAATKDAAKKGLKSAANALTASMPEDGKRKMQQMFTPYHRMLQDNDTPSAEYAAASDALTKLNNKVSTLARDSAPEQIALEWAKERMTAKQESLTEVQTASPRLPTPFNRWFQQVADDNWRLVLASAYQYINQQYKANVYSFYAGSLRGRYPFNHKTDVDVSLSDFTRFFKSGGIMDGFIEANLRPFVTGNSGYYQVKTIDGRGLPISNNTLAQFRAARVIQSGLFSENPVQPTVSFKLEPHFLEATLNRVILQIGNQQMEYRHGPILSSKFTWPDDMGDTSTVTERFEDLNGNKRTYQTEPGPWSLFRFVDQMQLNYASGRDVLILKTQVDGKYANYLLSTQRAPNPFDTKIYRAFSLRENL